MTITCRLPFSEYLNNQVLALLAASLHLSVQEKGVETQTAMDNLDIELRATVKEI
jgi:hypothetical protein